MFVLVLHEQFWVQFLSGDRFFALYVLTSCFIAFECLKKIKESWKSEKVFIMLNVFRVFDLYGGFEKMLITPDEQLKFKVCHFSFEIQRYKLKRCLSTA